MSIHQIITDFTLDIVVRGIDEGLSLSQVLSELSPEMRDSLTESDIDYAANYELDQQCRMTCA